MVGYDKYLIGVHPTLVRKYKAIKEDITPKLPTGWELVPVCGKRSVEDQIKAIRGGYSKIKLSSASKAPHVLNPSKALDVAWLHNGVLTWVAPKVTATIQGKKQTMDGWDLLDIAAKAHNIKRIRKKFGYTWDDRPHLELYSEDYYGK